MAFQDFTKTVTVGEYTLIYTAVDDGQVSLKVLSSQAEVLAIGSGLNYDTFPVINKVINDLNSSGTQYTQVIAYLSNSGSSDFLTVVNQARNVPAPSPSPPTPTINTTTTTAPATTTASTNTLAGPASDDSGAPGTPTNPPSPTNGANNPTATNVSPGTGPVTNAPTTPGGERPNPTGATTTAGNPPYANEEFIATSEPAGTRPGRRLTNPLGYLASYTYQLSLYMVTPAAYDAFVAGGKRNLNLFNEQVSINTTAPDQVAAAQKSGVFLVAQGGGLGPTEKRSPFFQYDYYLDNLTFTHIVNSSGTGAPVNNIDFKFQIIEPYGFSLMSNLRRAKEFLRDSPGGTNTSADPLRQFYVLGIKFYGWDQSGRQVSGKESFGDTELDPTAAGDGSLFETFYDLSINEMKFKMDGKATVYNVTAGCTSILSSVNTRKGMIKSNTSVSGTRVRDMLAGPNGLITKLNQEQQELARNNTIKHPVVYKIQWLGDAERIALSSMVTENKNDKSNQPASSATNTSQVNDATSTRTEPNNTVREMNVSDRTIIQAFDQIISNSEFAQNAIAYNYTDSNQNNASTTSPNTVSSPNQKFAWFNISPKITDIKWDDKINDWSYNITYVIQTYLAPVVDNPFVTNNIDYYGPHKRYDYWFTGDNREIISIEQSFNTVYYNTVVGGNPGAVGNLSSTGTTTSSTTPAETSTPAAAPATAPNTPSNADSEGAKGTLSMDAVNSVRTTLYDPDSYAKTKINLLGDPDFLTQDLPSLSGSINEAYSRFYNNNKPFTINPSSGQVFIEVDFKEAIDYSTSAVENVNGSGKGATGQGGTLSINDSILFYSYPDDVKDKIKGVVYLVHRVANTFKNGAFTQQLETAVPLFFARGQVSDSELQRLEAENQNPAGAGTTPQQPGQNANPGTTTDQPPAASTTASPSTAPASTTRTEPTT